MSNLKDVTQLLQTHPRKHDTLYNDHEIKAILGADKQIDAGYFATHKEVFPDYHCVKCEQGISDTEADLCGSYCTSCKIEKDGE